MPFDERYQNGVDELPFRVVRVHIFSRHLLELAGHLGLVFLICSQDNLDGDICRPQQDSPRRFHSRLNL